MSASPELSPEPWQQAFLDDNRLPAAYLGHARDFLEPIARRIARQQDRVGRPLFVAINGSQGSGKSTLSEYLGLCLGKRWSKSVAVLSLDDFYLTRARREALAATVHPLLVTRGVPGTHDIPLLNDTLDALRDAREGSLSLPRFNKARDDREPEASWPAVEAPVSVVLLEGWCLGARPETAAVLHEPVNALESDEDADGHWRGYANAQLAALYEPLYARMDLWIMLAAPGFDCVLRWRTEQEAKLRDRVGGVGAGLLDAAGLARFVAHFERWTNNCLRELPARADILLELDKDRRIVKTTGLSGSVE